MYFFIIVFDIKFVELDGHVIVNIARYLHPRDIAHIKSSVIEKFFNLIRAQTIYNIQQFNPYISVVQYYNLHNPKS